MKREGVLLIAIIVVAAAMRIYWNDVDNYSPADESMYTSYAKQLLDNGFVSGYPEIVRWFDDPKMWRYPSPLRFGHLALATAAVEMYGATEPRALAWLSTIAGILVVPLLYSFGKRLFDVRTGIVAAAFGAFSAIELAMGRRALQDEVFCLAVLVALMCVMTAMERGGRWDIVAAIVALTAALSIKESALLLYPAFLAIAIVYRPVRARHLLMFALPPVIDYVIFSLLARDAGAFVRISARVWGATSSKYVLQYQGGPPHRLLLDLFITAPLVSLLAAAAIAVILLGRNAGRRERALALFVVLAVAAFAILSSKNLRFVMVVDPVIRLLAAWVIATPVATGRTIGVPALAAIAAASAAIEIELFHAIFIRGGVYDPVTETLLQAVGSVPRADAIADPPMLFPWICAALIALAWMYERVRNHRTALRLH